MADREVSHFLYLDRGGARAPPAPHTPRAASFHYVWLAQLPAMVFVS